MATHPDCALRNDYHPKHYIGKADESLSFVCDGKPERTHTQSLADGGDALDHGERYGGRPAPEQGSYYWYRRYGGGFVNKFLDAVAQADGGNRQRLKLSFPQMVAAWELWYNNNDRDGNCAPDGFAPAPFAVAE